MSLWRRRRWPRLFGAVASLSSTWWVDGALRVELEAFVRTQGVGEHVRLYGWQSQDQVLEHLQTAHVLIAPSVTAPNGDQEGIPNTVKEGHGGRPTRPEHAS